MKEVASCKMLGGRKVHKGLIGDERRIKDTMKYRKCRYSKGRLEQFWVPWRKLGRGVKRFDLIALNVYSKVRIFLDKFTKSRD